MAEQTTVRLKIRSDGRVWGWGPIRIKVMRTLAVVLLMSAGLLPRAGDVNAQSQDTVPSGNAPRGKTLFEIKYKCYACHGYDGQTGSPRLVPMPRTQSAFIAYLRKPSTQGMPKFVDVPAQDLADVYVYIRSIPAAAPPVNTIPLLNDVLRRRSQATQTNKTN